jgi:iron complex outermembrane receptor protein
MKGFELDLAAQVTQGLVVRGGVGYLDAEYTNLSPGATVTLDSELVKTPKWTGSLTAENTWTLGDMGSFILGGDMSYRSSHFNEPSNYAILKQSAYTLYGAHASYQSASGSWRLTLYGTNLSDERYMTNGIQAVDSLGTADAAYGQPREYGLTLNATF